MKKSAKIAVAAVSVVMAGTMVFGMFGCDGCSDDSGKQEKYKVAEAGTDISNVTLNINIGDKANRSISFAYGELLSGTVTLPDGNTYNSSSLKPAWAAFQNMVGCKFNDVWQNASNKLTTAIDSTTSSGALSAMDIITDGASNITTNQDKLLDLSNYLDEMPNYKAFLEANPVVRMSLTSDTSTGAMYYAPYFDGNNDIEKYVLTKTNWITALLDGDLGTGDTTTTFKTSLAEKQSSNSEVVNTSSSITSYMGTTGSYTTDVVKSDGTVGSIKVNYDAALTAAKSTSTDLGGAISTAAGKTYDGTSGNIVDLMNFAINQKAGEVTGAQLLDIVKAYIDVAYQDASGNKFYTTRSDVFNSTSAAWDVDLYAALGRCLVTNPSLIKSGKTDTIGGTNATTLANLYLHCARATTMQRMIDTVSMVGELYGVRGLESKNLYSYIDADGTLKDARGDTESYEAMKAFNGFYKEGLVYAGGTGSDGVQSYYKSGTVEALTTYDYVNTQTAAGFQSAGIVSGKYNLEDGYNYTPILTPVSKWDEDGSDAIESDEYFRFTESWRTTKDTGFCIPVDNVKDDPTKLRAVLTFIDDMFSSDGQILLTYGPMANDKYVTQTSKSGWWSNPEATDAQVAAGTYFEYEGKKYYSETYYNGSYQPTLTDDAKNAYYGNEVNGFKFDGSMTQYMGDKQTMPTGTALTAALISKGSNVPAGTKVLKKDGSGYDELTEALKATADCYVVNGYLVNKNGYCLTSSFATVAKIASDVNTWITASTLNYTNFARYVIGSALPIGNKLQSFEFQLTSEMGRTGALRVDAAIKAGVIRHTENSVTENPWYTVVPTLLPYGDTTTLASTYSRLYTGNDGTTFSNNKDSKNAENLYYQIIKYGYDYTKIDDISTFTYLELDATTSATNIVKQLNAKDGLDAFTDKKNTAWQSAKTYYASIK